MSSEEIITWMAGGCELLMLNNSPCSASGICFYNILNIKTKLLSIFSTKVKTIPPTRNSSVTTR